jgi:hypothetical protein
MKRKKLTPEERLDLERTLEQGRKARREMQEILDWVEARWAARGLELPNRHS